MLTVRKPSYRNPYGEALLSRVWWPWFYRSKAWEFWMVYLERFGMPWVVGKTNSTNDDKINEFSEKLYTAVQDAVFVTGEGEDIQLVESKTSAGSTAFETIQGELAKSIQKVILGQTLTTDTGKGGGGSYALGKVHDGVRKDRRDTDVKLIAKTIQKIIDGLTYLNFPAAKPPIFVMEDGKTISKERAGRDKLLYDSGVRFTAPYLLRVYDFNEGDFYIVSDEIKPDKVKPDNKLKAQSFAHLLSLKQLEFDGADPEKFSESQQAIENLVAEMKLAGASVVDSGLLKKTILNANDEQELFDDLAVMLGDAGVDDFNNVMEQALFMADVWGYERGGSDSVT